MRFVRAAKLLVFERQRKTVPPSSPNDFIGDPVSSSIEAPGFRLKACRNDEFTS